MDRIKELEIVLFMEKSPKIRTRSFAVLRLITWALFSFIPLAQAEAPATTVTVTQKSPIQILAADGAVTGVTEASVGKHYALVSSDGRQLILQDEHGARIQIAIAATDYTPPVTAGPAAATNAPPSAVNAEPATSANSQGGSASTSIAPAASTLPVSDDGIAKINAGMGKAFFTSQNLWKESGLLLANRLGLRLEDKTKWETAYRRYFYNREGDYVPASILGGSAYCVALYADANDTPTSLLIAFTNDGDYKGVAKLRGEIGSLQDPSTPQPADANKQISDLMARLTSYQLSFEPDRQAEQETLTKNLTALFGDPQKTTFGSNVATREDALRWDWNDVSFLLTCQEKRYNLLRIIPTELADKHGRTERIPRQDMVEKLSSAVDHRANGDVVITQLPMADQGLKGYCVPATWERVLRYTGVPGDMYTLSRIGGGAFGGGERGASVARQLNDTLYDYGRKAEFLDFSKFDVYSLHHYIDEGIPIFWGVNPSGYAPVEQRYALCDRDKDWTEWKTLLDQSRSPSNPKPAPLEDMQGHQVLITGYNADTREIAWSDPWGRQTQERWMTLEEAQRCSLGEFYIITW